MIPRIKLTCALIVVVLVLVIQGCSRAPSTKSGTTNSNLNNSGLLVAADDWVYFLNLEDYAMIYRIKQDGTGLEKFSDTKAIFLNYYDDFLYYIGSDDQVIHRINTLDKSDEVVLNEIVSNLFIEDGIAYFIKENRLSKMVLTNQEVHPLSDQEVVAFNLENGIFYYLNSQRQLFKLKEIETQVSETSMNSFNVMDGIVYYVDGEDGLLYRMNNQGEDIKPLTDKRVSSFNVTLEWIYYGEMSENETDLTLMKMKHDGTEITEVAQASPMLICVDGDWIGYLDFNMNEFSFKSVIMKTDGSNKSEFVMKNENEVPEIERFQMSESVQMASYIITVTDAYATNILKNPEIEDDSVIFEQVTDGMYLFINAEVQNLSDEELQLYQRVGLRQELEDSVEGTVTYWAQVKEDKDDQYVMAGFSEEYNLKPKEQKFLQLFFPIDFKEFPLYLVMSEQANQEVTKAIEIVAEGRFVISSEEAQRMMEQRYPDVEVFQGGGLGFVLPGEDTEKMFYSFSIMEEGMDEPTYFLIERDSGTLYHGMYNPQYPDFPAVPTEPVE